ncbi:MAG: PilN domain-containing protein [Fibrobacter sp.]|jgi:Tfp pilus assembly protein PilN|nr:PilN domain-containing protein [Fibrobacter sp.]
MKYSDILLGRFFWCLEYRHPKARLVRFLRGRQKIVPAETFSGTLEECAGFLLKHGSALDGVLVLDDSFPVRLISSEEFSLLAADGEDAVFLPGVPYSELKIVENLSGDAVALLAKSAVESRIAELEQKGFLPLQLVPASFFYAGLFSPGKDSEGDIFIRANSVFSEIWVFQNAEFATAHRISGGLETLSHYFSDFYFQRYPASREYPVRLAGEEIFNAAAVSEALSSPVEVMTPEKDVLEVLAEDAWLLGIAKLPSWGSTVNSDPYRRLREARVFRKFLKVALSFTLGSLVVAALLWLSVAGYDFSRRNDRLELEKKIEAGRELASFSKKMEKDRHDLEELLKKKTRHASSLTEVIRVLDPGMWFSQIDIQGDRISLVGYALQENQISAYLSALEKSSALTRVRLRTTEKTTWRKRTVFRFHLVAEEVR